MYSAYAPHYEYSWARSDEYSEQEAYWREASSMQASPSTSAYGYVVAGPYQYGACGSLPHLQIPCRTAHGASSAAALSPETSSPLDRCTSSSSYSSGSHYDPLPSHGQDYDGFASSSWSHRSAGDSAIQPMDLSSDGQSSHPYSAGTPYDTHSSPYAESSGSYWATSDPAAASSCHTSPEQTWEAAHAMQSADAAYEYAVAPSYASISSPHPPPSAHGVARTTSSSEPAHPVASQHAAPADVLQPPAGEFPPSLVSDPAYTFSSHAPAHAPAPAAEVPLHHPRPIRYIQLKNFEAQLAAASELSPVAGAAPAPVPELLPAAAEAQARFEQPHFEQPETDGEAMDYSEGDDDDGSADETETPVDEAVEGIVLGPSIGLGAGPRTLGVGSLLFQPVSDVVRSQHALGDAQDGSPVDRGNPRERWDAPFDFSYHACASQPGSCLSVAAAF